MKPLKLAIVPVSVLAFAAAAWAGDVAPEDVKYEDGAVAASLSLWLMVQGVLQVDDFADAVIVEEELTLSEWHLEVD